MTIIGRMYQEMGEDDTDDSDRLVQLYDQADEKGKALLDDALICICGWGMESLKEKVGA